MTQLAIQVKGLVRRFEDVVAVAGLDLEVPAGQCVGLLGPNGAGKTTTVESLEGLHFSASRFPAWMQPVVQLLPLTALNDSLRAIMTDGVSLLALGRQLLVLVLWGLVPFALAVRYFRWT